MLGAIYVLHLKREDLQVPSCGESYSIGVQDLSHPSVVHTTCHGKSTCFGNAKLEPFLALPPASPATHSKRSNSCDIIWQLLYRYKRNLQQRDIKNARSVGRVTTRNANRSNATANMRVGVMQPDYSKHSLILSHKALWLPLTSDVASDDRSNDDGIGNKAYSDEDDDTVDVADSGQMLARMLRITNQSLARRQYPNMPLPLTLLTEINRVGLGTRTPLPPSLLVVSHLYTNCSEIEGFWRGPKLLVRQTLPSPNRVQFQWGSLKQKRYGI